jgi:outer membrane protein assembly factor BamB
MQKFNPKKPLILIILVIFSGISVSCERHFNTSASFSDPIRHTGEGALPTQNETFIENITSNSILNIQKMEQAGFHLDWRNALMNHEKIRHLYLHDDSIIVETESNQIHSLDRFTGHYKWLIQLKHPLDFPPYFMASQVDKQRILYCVSRNYLYAIDMTKSITGKELGVLKWKYSLDYSPSSPPYANEFFLSFGTEEKNFIATLKTRQDKSSSDDKPRFILWKRILNGKITSRPSSASLGEKANLMVATENGKIYGLDFNSGKIIWQYPKNSRAGAFKAPLVVHGDGIYAVNEDYTLYVISRQTSLLNGKIALDAPLRQSPIPIGDLEILYDKSGNEIINIKNDLDIFIQSDPSYYDKEGIFYDIHVDKIIKSKLTQIENTEKTQALYSWVLKINWKLKGKYQYLFRTRSEVFLKHKQDIIVVNRKDGQLLRTIDMGDVPLIVHHDPLSNYKQNRLFIATKNGQIYSLKLK